MLGTPATGQRISAGAPEHAATGAGGFPHFPLVRYPLNQLTGDNAHSARSSRFRRHRQRNGDADTWTPLAATRPTCRPETGAESIERARFGRGGKIGKRTRHNDPVILESFNGKALEIPPCIVAEKITRLLRKIWSLVRSEIVPDPQKSCYFMLF